MKGAFRHCLQVPVTRGATSTSYLHYRATRSRRAERRDRLGDIEVDLTGGKAHKSALLVLTDRATRLTKLRKVSSRKAEPMAEAIIDQLSDIPSSFIKTLTFDNDKAFARHQDIAEALGADTYFTRPYTSQDKGTVENRSWVIRRFFPKGTDLRKGSSQRISTVEQYLNFRPIRKFDYLNPTQQTLKHRCVALITWTRLEINYTYGVYNLLLS